MALVLTGHSMAVARGMPGVAGYVEYCIGHTPVMVAVDAEGNPTGESHICPEFSLSLLNLVAEETAQIVAPQGRAHRLVVTEPDVAHLIRILKGAARAPPVRT